MRLHCAGALVGRPFGRSDGTSWVPDYFVPFVPEAAAPKFESCPLLMHLNECPCCKSQPPRWPLELLVLLDVN